MKKFIFIFFGFGLIFQGCGNFGDINVNPTLPSKLPPNIQLNHAIQLSSFPSSMLYYENIIVQYGMAQNLGVWQGANVNQLNINATNGVWVNYYENAVNQLVDALDSSKYNIIYANGYQEARIWKAYVFMILTDTYGDIPYFQAGQGYIKKIDAPVYDAQSDIYQNIIFELTDASSKLDASKDVEATDVLYQGDIGRWKRLANSLLLRAGMRLVKVNPTLAQSTVQAAVAGGVMTSNADNAYFKHENNYQNQLSAQLNATEKANYYVNNTFVTYLQSTNDPRLDAISVVYNDPAKDISGITVKDTISTNQIGMISGYAIPNLINSTNYPGSVLHKAPQGFNYSQFNRESIASITAPNFFVTYAQTCLLLAEAEQRGWVTVAGKSVSDLYNTGITAHMQQLASYGTYGVINSNQITAYLAANPLIAGNELQQINTQYWVACIGNPSESWSNLRRSGYPNFLLSNPSSQQDVVPAGSIIRRLVYPINERNYNNANLQVAIGRLQGGDRLDSHVWWDTK